jgi:hypothetical protein
MAMSWCGMPLVLVPNPFVVCFLHCFPATYHGKTIIIIVVVVAEGKVGPILALTK